MPESSPTIRADVDATTDTNFFHAYADDLSDGGLFVATYVIRPVGSRVRVFVHMPDESPIVAWGTVAWVRDARDGSMVPGMGIRFEPLADHDRDAILRFTRGRAPLFYDL